MKHRTERTTHPAGSVMRKLRGFTLVELMVVVCIVALISVFATPSMTRLVRDLRVSGTTNEMVAALNTARTEAIKRGRLVGVCGVSDPNNAASCGGTANWGNGNGWIIYEANNSLDVKEVIARHTQVGANINVIPMGLSGTSVVFTPVGRLVSGGGANFEFNYKSACKRKVEIGMSGRISVEPRKSDDPCK